MGGISDTELLRGILRGAPVRIAVFDRAGRLLLDPDPNPPMPSDVGVPAGANFFELYGHVPGIRDAANAAFSGEEVRLTREIGGATYIGAFTPLRSPAGEIDSVMGVATVFSDGTAVERALAEMQIRERQIFNSHMVGMLYWGADGAVIDANDSYLSMLGYTRDDLSNGRISWRKITPPEFHAMDEAAVHEVVTRGACTPYEKQYFHSDGTRVDVLIGACAWTLGETAGAAFVVNISERKRIERRGREAEARLMHVLSIAPVIVWSVDASGVITLSTGRSDGEGLPVVGQSAYKLFASTPAVEQAIRKCLSGEGLTQRIVLGERVFDHLFTPQLDPAGSVDGVLCVAIDVTERQRAEQEHERLREQLLRVQKLESLGLLAGGIAHDFNNILTPIMGAASSAMLTIPSENPAYTDLEMVVAAARRAAGLTRQMLAYSGKAQVDIRVLDLSRHVREITNLIETTVPKKVQLRLELAPDLPAIEADVAQIQQVVMNLVINAAEAIGDQQGTVLVTTGRQVVDLEYVQSLFAAEGLSPGDYVFIEVHDTGHGMDEATKDKIFDPFFTTKFTGRGLGLAAVLGIVRSHRGAIKVYSSPGRGTTFKVFFPAHEQVARADTVSPVKMYRGKGLVLVIDDDRGVRETARRMLEAFGFSVIDAEDGQAGAVAFAANAAQIVLTLVDMTMPKMNGEETFRAIRRIRAEAPVILTSGYNEIEATRRFVSRGLAGFLEKPFTPADLANKLSAVLGPSIA
ncbi:MAG TPA: ATP-binding protein [Polyangiales bacterium]|nr:ATP-binding protein [Polyangiales bacterium]